MAKNKHLTLSEHICTETGRTRGLSFRSITGELEKSPSTIAREIKTRSLSGFVKVPHRHANACLHRRNCSQVDLCLPCQYKRLRSSCSLYSTCHDVCPDSEEVLFPTFLALPISATVVPITIIAPSEGLHPKLE